MSAKILPFRSPRGPRPVQEPQLVSCPFCTYFTDDKSEMERHMNADHARAMALYGFKKELDKQPS